MLHRLDTQICMYSPAMSEQEKEMRLNLGLQKLIQGAKDVAAMKIVLAEEQKKLEVATAETMKMLSSLEVSSAEARKEGDQASGRCNVRHLEVPGVRRRQRHVMKPERNAPRFCWRRMS